MLSHFSQSLAVSRACDPIEDDPGEVGSCDCSGSASTPAVGVEDDRAVGVDLEAGIGFGDVVADDEVEALGCELLGGVLHEVVGLGREPDEHLTRRLVATEVDEEVVGGLEHDLGDAVVLLELAVGRRLRVGSRRPRPPCTMTSHVGRTRTSTASCISRGGLHRARSRRRPAPDGRWW